MLQNKTRHMPVKKDQLAYFVEGEWGQEECLVNHEKYCGKRMLVKKAFQCSMHYHKVKEETFYLVSGKIQFDIEYEGKKSSRIMTSGDVQHVHTGMWHHFIVLEDAEIFEFSTFHTDSDSYCKEENTRIEWKLCTGDSDTG